MIEVDPFDQPDVEHAKDLARQAMEHRAAPAAAVTPYGARVDPKGGPVADLDPWLASIRSGDYVAVQAFLAPEPATGEALDALASALRRRCGTPVTVGFGPRFLHSTGQLHKGGPPSGAFLQIVDEPVEDLEVPELGLTFGTILRAQARGDRGALEEKHRRLVVANVGATPAAGVRRLAAQVARAAP